MASVAVAPISQSRSLCNSLQLRAAAPKKLPPNFSSVTITNFTPNSTVFAGKLGSLSAAKKKMVVVVSASMAEKSKKRYPGESKGFVGEMRLLVKKLQTMRDQTKEGKKEPQGKPAAKRKPTIEGYLMFLVDSKLVYDTIEEIVAKAHFPEYAEFRNTGLERSESLAKDLEWFKEQGHVIPEPSTRGVSYANYLKELSKKDPKAFICHFYNIYFRYAARRMIGKKVAEKILNSKELEFYKWNGDLLQMLRNVIKKLNRIAISWTKEEKQHCFKETMKSSKFSVNIMRLIVS